MRGYVYTARDVAGNVVYVGTTRDVTARIQAHRRTSRWWPLHRSLDIEEFATLEAAAAAENDGICRYDPPYNVRGGHAVHGVCAGRRCERLRNEIVRREAWRRTRMSRGTRWCAPPLQEWDEVCGLPVALRRPAKGWSGRSPFPTRLSKRLPKRLSKQLSIRLSIRLPIRMSKRLTVRARTRMTMWSWTRLKAAAPEARPEEWSCGRSRVQSARVLDLAAIDLDDLAEALQGHALQDARAVAPARSSLWRRGEDGWRLLFHQGTVL